MVVDLPDLVRTRSWMGPPQKKRAPRVGPTCIVILAGGGRLARPGLVGIYSRCCIRVFSAMVGVPHRPLLPSLPAAFPLAPPETGVSLQMRFHIPS